MSEQQTESKPIFYSEVARSLQQAGNALVQRVPELDGLVISYIWKKALHHAPNLPRGQILLAANDDSSVLSRAVEQQCRVTHMLTESIEHHLSRLNEEAVKMDEEIDAKRQALKQLEARQNGVADQNSATTKKA